MLDALKKFRAEAGSRADVERFVSIVLSRVRIDMSPADAIRFVMLARVTAACRKLGGHDDFELEPASPPTQSGERSVSGSTTGKGLK